MTEQYAGQLPLQPSGMHIVVSPLPPRTDFNAIAPSADTTFTVSPGSKEELNVITAVPPGRTSEESMEKSTRILLIYTAIFDNFVFPVFLTSISLSDTELILISASSGDIICSDASVPVSVTTDNVCVENKYANDASETDIIKSRIATIIDDTPLIIVLDFSD
jgi:hypothetical protein